MNPDACAALPPAFLEWEGKARDAIDCKRHYIDLAGGDVVAGLLLSQIMYWHLPPKKGGPHRMCVQGCAAW